MKRFSFIAVLLALTLMGCPAPERNTTGTNGGNTNSNTTDANNSEPGDTSPAADDSSAATDDSSASGDGDPAGGDSTVELSATNTLIQFVGTHTDPEKPDPRTGTFEELTGTAVVEEGALKSIHVDIKTASLTTDIPKLTDHLRSVDFFNAKEQPDASFKSTSIEDGGEGKLNITGDLTLLGETKSITFPATAGRVRLSSSGASTRSYGPT